MARDRAEPFQLALTDLRERLREGRLPPGARVVAKDVAEALKLSATPVREALSRLAGQGLLEERRGDGFFVPGLEAVDIADLYRVAHAILTLSQAADRQPRRDLARPMTLRIGEDPVRAIEGLFTLWVAESASRTLTATFRIAAIRIAPVRRLEVRLISLQSEAEELLALADSTGRAARPDALDRFYDRRIVLAEQLARLIDPDGTMQT